MDLWIGALSAIVAVGLGIILYIQKSGDSKRFAYVAFASGAYVSALTVLFATHSEAMSDVVIATGACALIAALLFALQYQRTMRRQEWWYITPMVLVIALSPTDLFIAGSQVRAGELEPIHGQLAAVLAGTVFVHCLYIVWLLWSAERRSTGIEKIQARVIVIAFGLLLISIFLCNVLAPVIGFSSGNMITALGLMLFVGCVAYALVVAKLFELEQLQRREQDYQEQIASQRRVMAEIAHGLQTPLAIVRAELEGEKRVPDDIRKNIERGIADLSTRLNSLIKYAKSSVIIAKKAKLIRVDTHIQEIVDYVAVVAASRGVQVKSSLEEAYYPILGEDLETVITNLLSNGVEYARRGERIHTVFISALRSDNGLVVIVRDTGPGMTEEEVSLAHEALFRGSTARSGTGMGLGLAIVRQIVGRYRGTLNIRNHPDGGLEVRIELPSPQQLLQ